MPADVVPRTTNANRRRVVIRVTLITFFLSGVFWVYGIFNPSWRVRVYILNLPAGTYFVSLIAESEGTLRNMDWSPTSELSTPFTMHPADCSWSCLVNPVDPKVDWHAYVQWQSGRRYGVLTQDTGGSWRVIWFEADKSPIPGLKRFLGVGEATFDVVVGKMMRLPAEDVIALGLDKVERRP